MACSETILPLFLPMTCQRHYKMSSWHSQSSKLCSSFLKLKKNIGGVKTPGDRFASNLTSNPSLPQELNRSISSPTTTTTTTTTTTSSSPTTTGSPPSSTSSVSCREMETPSTRVAQRGEKFWVFYNYIQSDMKLSRRLVQLGRPLEDHEK